MDEVERKRERERERERDQQIELTPMPVFDSRGILRPDGQTWRGSTVVLGVLGLLSGALLAWASQPPVGTAPGVRGSPSGMSACIMPGSLVPDATLAGLVPLPRSRNPGAGSGEHGIKVLNISAARPDFVAVIEYRGQNLVAQTGTLLPDELSPILEIRRISRESVTAVFVRSGKELELRPGQT